MCNDYPAQALKCKHIPDEYIWAYNADVCTPYKFFNNCSSQADIVNMEVQYMEDFFVDVNRNIQLSKC